MSQSKKPKAFVPTTTSTQATEPQGSASYAEKTARLQAITQLVKTLQPFIWAIVLMVVIIPLAGKYLIDQSMLARNPVVPPQPVQEVVVESPNWSEVDQAVAEALTQAHTIAESYASQELERWEIELEPRIEGFLDWYFDFLNQKKMEFSTPFIWGVAAINHQLHPDKPTAKTAVLEHLTESFEKEFSKRVLVPKNAQLCLEVITTNTVTQYLAALSDKVGAVQTRYHIPQGQWERYLGDIALTLGNEGTVSNLSLKTLAGGGTYLAAKPLVLASLSKLGSKASAKLAGSAVTKVAAKTGGTVAAEFGAAALDPIVGVGILIWDVLDYRHTVSVDRPVLRENLTAYLQDVKQILLNNPETGVMTAIREIEQGILASL